MLNIILVKKRENKYNSKGTKNQVLSDGWTSREDVDFEIILMVVKMTLPLQALQNNTEK